MLGGGEEGSACGVGGWDLGVSGFGFRVQGLRFMEWTDSFSLIFFWKSAHTAGNSRTIPRDFRLIFNTLKPRVG